MSAEFSNKKCLFEHLLPDFVEPFDVIDDGLFELFIYLVYQIISLFQMSGKESSIFDQDFLQQVSIRRRKLMPLALKIYVWLFLIVWAFLFLGPLYIYLRYPKVYDIDFSNVSGFLGQFCAFAYCILRFLANLFILLEKKWAILMACVMSGFSLLLWTFFFGLQFYQGGFAVTLSGESLLMLSAIVLEIPYVIMLLRIRQKWVKADPYR